MKGEDFTGRVFGKWVVIGHDREGKNGGSYWFVKCSCNTSEIKSVSISYLEKGRSKSCRCIRLEVEDHTGAIYGKWTVLNFDRRENRRTFWWAKCSCNLSEIRSVNISSLKRGKSTSCGCNKVGEAAKNKVKKMYLDSAGKRNLVWELTDDEFDILTSNDCHYCGRKSSNVGKGDNGDFIYNGIDRKDNNLGYITYNVVSCCKICNYAKRNMAYEEFVAWLRDVTLFNISKFLVEEV